MYKIAKLFLILLFLPLFFTLLIYPPHTYSQVTPPEVQVDHIARGFEKVAERLKLYSKFSRESKIDFQIYLVQKRFAELKYVIDNNKVNLVEETAARYGAYVGRLSDYMLKKNAKNKTEQVLKMYENHSQAIHGFQTNFKYDSGWWLALQHDINILAEFSTKLRSL